MSSLGIYTKSASALVSEESFSSRKTLFRMLDVFGNLVPNHRTADCLKHVSKTARYVEIRKSERGARYNGLCVCGRVWTCPYCANRISSHRRTELAYAVGRWLNSCESNQVALATYTIQHDKDMSLNECLKTLSGCYRKLHSGRWYQSQKASHKIIGSVRTVELTWGMNGYHTHIHELIFHNSDNWTQLCEDMATKWIQLTHSVGNMTNEHGFDFQCAKEDVYAYVSKHGHLPLREWSLAHEVTRAAAKSGRENRTYMKVLFDIAHGKVNERDRRFITAYCNGMSGVRQLVWSAGLKDLFNIGEIDDEKISEMSQDDSSDQLYAIISLDAWKIINDKFKRGEVLQKASELNFESFQFWIKTITNIDTVSINTAKDTTHLMSGGVARAREGK